MKSREKLRSRPEIREILDKLHKQGEVSGFTSGAFDLLHAGHIDYLEKARAQCDLLIVALNSDRSIKKYKSEKRPINSEADRAKVLCALECVDHVFIFDELNNNENIGLLKPKVYFKAADYSKEQLSSAPLVEAYGGKVELVEATADQSTTGIIERILDRYHPAITDGIELPTSPKRPAVFLDRDGTIIELVEYLHEPSKVKFFDDALVTLKKLKEAGYRLVIVTNQPGIGLGYFSKEDFFALNKVLLKEFSGHGIDIDKIYFCPHSKSENCSCRKPATAMIERADRELGLDLANSFMIGDMTSDVAFGKNAGCKSILLETGASGKDGLYDVKPDYTAKSLSDAADFILKEKKLSSVKKK